MTTERRERSERMTTELSIEEQLKNHKVQLNTWRMILEYLLQRRQL